MSAEGERAGARRPVEAWEVPLLERCGAELVGLRRRLGVTQAALADVALLTPQGLRRIEHGLRRTRRSTLERLAHGLVLLAEPPDPDLDEASIVAWLVRCAGEALAAESGSAAKGLRRAHRRKARREAPLPAGLDQLVERRARRMADRLIERGYPWEWTQR